MKYWTQIVDIPDIGGGFSSWWDTFSFFFIIDSEHSIFSAIINDELEPKFQAQLLILTLDKVDASNYNQYFMEGITNCLLVPIRDWAKNCEEKATGNKAKYNYAKKIRDIDKYEKEFVRGIPENRIPEICNTLQIKIEIDLPSTVNTKTKFISIDCKNGPKKKKNQKVFKYIDTCWNKAWTELRWKGKENK